MFSTKNTASIYTQLNDFLDNTDLIQADFRCLLTEFVHQQPTPDSLKEKSQLARKLRDFQVFYSIEKNHLQTSPIGKFNELHLSASIRDISENEEELTKLTVKLAELNEDAINEAACKYQMFFKNQLNELFLGIDTEFSPDEQKEAVKDTITRRWKNYWQSDKMKYQMFFTTNLFKNGLIDFNDKFWEENLINTLHFSFGNQFNDTDNRFILKQNQFDTILHREHHQLVKNYQLINRHTTVAEIGNLQPVRYKDVSQLCDNFVMTGLFHSCFALHRTGQITDNEARLGYTCLLNDVVLAYRIVHEMLDFNMDASNWDYFFNPTNNYPELFKDILNILGKKSVIRYFQKNLNFYRNLGLQNIYLPEYVKLLFNEPVEVNNLMVSEMVNDNYFNNIKIAICSNKNVVLTFKSLGNVTAKNKDKIKIRLDEIQALEQRHHVKVKMENWDKLKLMKLGCIS